MEALEQICYPRQLVVCYQSTSGLWVVAIVLVDFNLPNGYLRVARPILSFPRTREVPCSSAIGIRQLLPTSLSTQFRLQRLAGDVVNKSLIAADCCHRLVLSVVRFLDVPAGMVIFPPPQEIVFIGESSRTKLERALSSLNRVVNFVFALVHDAMKPSLVLVHVPVGPHLRIPCMEDRLPRCVQKDSCPASDVAEAVFLCRPLSRREHDPLLPEHLLFKAPSKCTLLDMKPKFRLQTSGCAYIVRLALDDHPVGQAHRGRTVRSRTPPHTVLV